MSHNVQEFVDRMSQIPYPKKENFYRLYIYKKGKVILSDVLYKDDRFINLIENITGVPQKYSEYAYRKYEKILEDAGYLVEVEYLKDEYNEAVKEYHAEESFIMKEFEQWLAEEFAVTGHTNRHKLYAKAYQLGHSSGLHEIFNVYADLVELIK